MSLEEKTAAVKQLQAGEAVAQHRAGRILDEVRDNQLFKPKHRSFNRYLMAELSEMERAWAYLLMAVGESFAEEHAAQYGIKPLNELCKLSREVFLGSKPADLLVGEHRFIDADGDERVLDFQKDHSLAALKGLVAEARHGQDRQKASGVEPDPGIERISQALQAAARESTGAAVEVRQKKEGVRVAVEGPTQQVEQVLRKVGAEFPSFK